MTSIAGLLNRARATAQVFWSPGALVGLVLLGALFTESAAADEHHYVLRDGTKVPIVYSPTEIGVVLRRDVETKSAKTRLKATCDGELMDVPAVPDSRFKLLGVTKATAKRRDLARQDSAIRTVGKVFRFEGSPGPVLTFGQIVVKLRGDLSVEQRQAVWSDYGLTNIKPFEGLADVYTCVVAVNEDEVLRAEHLADDERTEWASPDLIQITRTQQLIPTDPLFDQQWHLNNTGQVADSVVGADIDVLGAWATADGNGVLFGMFDDSCDVDHEDLVDRYIGIGQDVSLSAEDPDFNNPRPKQLADFHGTAVMGLAVATGNAVGVRGVSFRSNFTASRGLGEFVPDSAIASAYLFAVAQGVDVHINSWGFIFPVPNPPIIEAAIQTAFLEGRDPDGSGDAEPLGMLIFFAAGNGDFFTGIGVENETGLELSTLPTVIGVGATSDHDTLAGFSNFGRDINFVAPGAANIVTVDNEDGTNPGPGMNLGGALSDPDFGFVIRDPFGFSIPQIDPEGEYNGFFNGTSAACPIAAGIAGLILSVDPALTASEVRLIMEHTCDKVDKANADYNGITNRSLRYGYGRVNARRAVEATQDGLLNGGVWPEIPSDVGVIGATLSWVASDNTNDFLVVKARRDFGFIPEDDECYHEDQPGCETAALAELPEDVEVLFAGCTGATGCAEGSQQSVAFDPPDFGRLFFGIFARNAIGAANAVHQYSFGVPIDSEAGTSGGETGSETIRPPAVTISATPLRGVSPLKVTFNGNAVGDLEIDGSKSEWDFDVVDSVGTTVTPEKIDALKYVVKYEVAPGATKVFTARLRMFDVVDNEGSASVQIRVIGPSEDSPTGESSAADVSIGIDAARSLDSLCETSVCGRSPFGALYRVDTSESNVALSVQSVVWDLGDGTTSASQSVSHTYINESDVPFVIPVSATIVFVTENGATVPRSLTRLITILPGTAVADPDNPDLPGTEVFGEGGVATPCGVITIMPLLGCFGGLFWLRRRGA